MKEAPYFELFEGKDVSLSDIKAANHGLADAAYQLVKLGTVVGQYTLEGEVILWMPKAREVSLIDHKKEVKNGKTVLR